MLLLCVLSALKEQSAWPSSSLKRTERHQRFVLLVINFVLLFSFFFYFVLFFLLNAFLSNGFGAKWLKILLSQACKSRRHRQVEVDLTSNEAGPSNMSGSTRISKPSLKARTNENVHISGRSLLPPTLISDTITK